jgi:AcrR family transcriptional regulator
MSASSASAPDQGDVPVSPDTGAQPGHRERLIAAMATAIEGKEYRETTVADVVRLARTSRRSFYEQFEDRDACFLALFDATNDAMMRRVAEGVDPDATFDEQVDAAVAGYISSVTDHPALFQSFVRELPALGAVGAERSAAALERFARTLIALVDAAAAAQPGIVRRPLTIDTAIIIVGGLRELLVFSVQSGRDLQELRATVGATAKAILRGTVL